MSDNRNPKDAPGEADRAAHPGRHAPGSGALEHPRGGTATPAERAASTSSRRGSACALARRSTWLAAQRRDFVDALLAAARIRDFPGGAVVIEAHDEQSGLHFLVHGSVQLTVPRPYQELSLAHIVLPGEWFGEASSVARLTSPAEYRSRGRCVTLCVPRQELALLQRSSPGAGAAMLELLAASVSRLTEVVADAAGLDPSGRVISKLLSLSEPVSGRDSCSLPVTQFVLAELCSVSRTTVCKVVAELEAREAVACSYAEIHILSRRALLAALRDHIRSEA
jgi:CRP/FNR family cyclic AMP-dependent transcriptional regulator